MVFISYAREDKEIARQICSDLKKKGISVWIDFENLHVGDNWEKEIFRAIQECDFFLALLSLKSLSKRGFVQKEVKYALELLDEFPAEEVFILPVGLDNCNPSDKKLQSIHKVDLFSSYEQGIIELIKVINNKKCISNNTDKRETNKYNNYSLSNQKNKKNYKQYSLLIILFFCLIYFWLNINHILYNNRSMNKGDNNKVLLKPKYLLRKKAISVNDEQTEKYFKLKDNKPLFYMQNDFKNNNDGTIIDYATGLIWQKSGSKEPLNYIKAHEYIKQLNYNNVYNWRIPTIDELMSLIEPEGAYNISPIFDFKQAWCWSSDLRPPNSAWHVDFNNGTIYWCFKTSGSYVRAVRN